MIEDKAVWAPPVAFGGLYNACKHSIFNTQYHYYFLTNTGDHLQ